MSKEGEIPSPTTSQLIFVRHGDSNYTNKYPDLTPKGVSQIELSVERLKTHLEKFDLIIFVSSPAERAKTSRDVFLNKLGPNERVDRKTRNYLSVRPADLLDAEGYDNYEERFLRNHPESSGEKMWLTDSNLDRDNALIEPRNKVNRRTKRFLYRVGKIIERVSKEDHPKKIAVVVFTHFEIGMNFFQGRLLENEDHLLQKGEPVIVELNSPTQNQYTIIARGKSIKVTYE